MAVYSQYIYPFSQFITCEDMQWFSGLFYIKYPSVLFFYLFSFYYI